MIQNQFHSRAQGSVSQGPLVPPLPGKLPSEPMKTRVSTGALRVLSCYQTGKGGKRVGRAFGSAVKTPLGLDLGCQRCRRRLNPLGPSASSYASLPNCITS